MLFFAYPTNNSTLDAFNYAANIRYGQDLFSPHHLLYNFFLYYIVNFIKLFLPNIEVLSSLKAINSFFVLATLFVLYKILLKLKFKINEILVLLLFVAFSYNTLRFGTENETYIIPIFFSILGTFFFLKYIEKPNFKFIFLSGLFASIACLFHQIHFFWWLGLLLGLILYHKNYKSIFVFSISAIIVPISYILVIYFYLQEKITFFSLSHFIFHDYYTGSAKSEIGLFNFVFIIISSFRSFFQIHPNIIFLIKKNSIYIIPIIILFFWIIKTIILICRHSLFVKREITNYIFLKTSILILVLHFLFAFYSVGNVKFLVMIPLLFTITIFYSLKFNKKFLKVTIFLLLIWNFMYGVYPNNKYNFYNHEFLVDYIYKHPKDLFFVENPDVINLFYYNTGIDNYDKIILKEKVKSNREMDSIIEKYDIYTDIINKPVIFNRSKVLSNKTNIFDFNKYKIEKVSEYSSFYGVSTINRIRK